MENTETPTPRHILAFVDAPDPDNFVQLIALHKLNPGAEVHVVLTGRPVRFNAQKDHALWEWDGVSSRMAQEASAMRIKNFLRHFGVTVTRVFDGGIAPRTLVPHWIHFAEYYKFFDVDPLAAIRHSELEPQEELLKLILALPQKSVPVAVGGPMTGLHQLIVRCPDVVTRFSELHAMFATWGNVELMQFDDKPRGAVQFNVACDPQAAHAVRVGVVLVVVAEQVEESVDDHMGKMVAQALAFGLRFPRHRLVGDHDVAESRRVDLDRKRQDVGRLRQAPPFGVEVGDEGVVAKNDAEFGRLGHRRATRGQRGLDRLACQTIEITHRAPGFGLDRDIDRDGLSLRSHAASFTARLSRLARSLEGRRRGVLRAPCRGLVGADDAPHQIVADDVALPEDDVPDSFETRKQRDRLAEGRSAVRAADRSASGRRSRSSATPRRGGSGTSSSASRRHSALRRAARRRWSASGRA